MEKYTKDEDFGRMKMAEFLQEKPEDNGMPIPMSCIWVLATQLDECKTEKEQWDWMSKMMLYYFNMRANPVANCERTRLKMVREMMVVVNLFDNRVRFEK